MGVPERTRVWTFVMYMCGQVGVHERGDVGTQRNPGVGGGRCCGGGGGLLVSRACNASAESAFALFSLPLFSPWAIPLAGCGVPHVWLLILSFFFFFFLR